MSWPAWGWVLAGCALRLLWPNDFLFRLDESVHVEYSLRVSRAGEWIRHAWPSSVGLENGPVFVYYLAAFTRLSLDPLVSNLSIVLANVAALALSVPFFRRVLGSEAEANTALALYATSPVAIWYSRKIWDPCLLPLFTVPALALAMRVLGGRGSRAIVAIPILLALAVQIHQSALFFALVLAVILLSDVRRIAPGWLLAGVALAALALAPYASYLLPRVFSDAGDLTLRAGSRWPDIDVVTNLLLDASGHNILQSAGREGGWLLLWPIPPLGLLVQLAAIPFYVYVFLGYAEAWRPATRLAPGVRRLLLGLAVGLPLVYLALRVRGVAHYFLTILPVLFALIVLGARRIARWSRPRRWVFPLPVLLAVNVASWLLFQSYMSFHDGSENYGMTYGRLAQACEEVAERARDLGKGSGEAPLRLVVDIPRDRGVIPHQYRYVLEKMQGIRVEPPEEGEEPDLVLRVRWPKPGRLTEPPYEILD